MDDGGIVRGLRGGDPGDAYRRYAAGLFDYAYLLLGEPEPAGDVLRDTLLDAVDHAGTITDTNLRSWLYSTVRDRSHRLGGRGLGLEREAAELVDGHGLDVDEAAAVMNQPLRSTMELATAGRASDRISVGGGQAEEAPTVTAYVPLPPSLLDRPPGAPEPDGPTEWKHARPRTGPPRWVAVLATAFVVILLVVSASFLLVKQKDGGGDADRVVAVPSPTVSTSDDSSPPQPGESATPSASTSNASPAPSSSRASRAPGVTTANRNPGIRRAPPSNLRPPPPNVTLPTKAPPASPAPSTSPAPSASPLPALTVSGGFADSTTGCPTGWKGWVGVNIGNGTADRVTLTVWWDGSGRTDHQMGYWSSTQFLYTVEGLPYGKTVSYQATAYAPDGRTASTPVQTTFKARC